MLPYSLLGTVSSSTFAVQDLDMEFSSTPDKYAYYYVKAYNSNNNTYSGRTNIVSAAGEYIPAKRSETYEIIQKREFSLSQNYPNPFNPVTRIDYSIKESGFVSLRVYDTIGNEVSTLVNENKPAGSYSVNFNAGSLPSGMYIYRLTSGKFTSSKKLIVIK